MKNPMPYPWKAAKISLSLNPFGFWLIPRGRVRREMTEHARQQGEKIWWFRWAWFQIEYARWV